MSNDDLYHHVFILSRVFRSLSSVNDLDLLDRTFDLIIKSFINITFEFLESLAAKEKGPEKDLADKLLALMSNFIPYVTQVIISEAILHKNLLRFLESKVTELEEIFSENQYKLMILYFLILDIDCNKNIYIVENVLSFIKMRSLKSISALRFLYYLKFRCDGNKGNEDIFKNAIFQLQSGLKTKNQKAHIVTNIEKELITHKILENQN